MSIVMEKAGLEPIYLFIYFERNLDINASTWDAKLVPSMFPLDIWHITITLTYKNLYRF